MIPVEYGVRFRVFTDRSLGANRYGLLLSGSCDYSGGVRVIRQGGVEKLAEKAGLSFSWGTRYNPGANSFAWIYPWSDMLRVNLDIDGTELAVEGDEGFSVENGHGDVMVRLPLYYYSTEIDDEAGTLTFWVCQYKISDAYQPDPLHLRPDGTVNRGWEYIAAFYSRFDSSHNVNTGAAKSYTNAYSGDAGTQTKYTRYLQACCRRKGSGWRAFDWRAWAYIWRLNVIQNARLDYFGGHCRDNPWEASAYISSGTHLILAKYVVPTAQCQRVPRPSAGIASDGRPPRGTPGHHRGAGGLPRPRGCRERWRHVRLGKYRCGGKL